jgi:hypothetical protein
VHPTPIVKNGHTLLGLLHQDISDSRGTLALGKHAAVLFDLSAQASLLEKANDFLTGILMQAVAKKPPLRTKGTEKIPDRACMTQVAASSPGE